MSRPPLIVRLRAAEQADAFIRSLSDEALTVVPDYEEDAFPDLTHTSDG